MSQHSWALRTGPAHSKQTYTGVSKLISVTDTKEPSGSNAKGRKELGILGGFTPTGSHSACFKEWPTEPRSFVIHVSATQHSLSSDKDGDLRH